MLDAFVTALALMGEPKTETPATPPASVATTPARRADAASDLAEPAGSAKPTPPPAPPTPPAARLRYRLVDANGQAWEHEDAAYLQSWVLQRNAQVSRPAVIYRGCPGGVCPR